VNTELFLDIYKTFNLKVMPVVDQSHYCEDEEIENYLVEVLPVNKSSWLTFYVTKQFHLALNSSSLGYRKVENSQGLLDLPDGIYEFKQSYKPNIQTVAHYYHMRTTAITLKYVELLCKHFQNECKKEERVYNEETLQLTKIKQYIDAAEYSVSEKHCKEDGIKYYNQAVELIKQFEHECLCR